MEDAPLIEREEWIRELDAEDVFIDEEWLKGLKL
jgi:hypothetical protein